jgi:hypothetical protein
LLWNREGDGLKDEIIKIGDTKYSLKNCLGFDAWEIYCKTTPKVQALTKIVITNWLIEIFHSNDGSQTTASSRTSPDGRGMDD